MTALSDHKGIVTISTGFRTSGSDRIFAAIYNAVTALDPGADQAEQNQRAEIALWLSVTKTVTVTSDASEQLRSLAAFWTWYSTSVIDPRGRPITNDPTLLAEAYERFVEMVAIEFARLWRRAFNEAQVIYPAAIEAAHPSTLTPKQLEDPQTRAPVLSGGDGSATEPDATLPV
jgi:hypothetical protein